MTYFTVNYSALKDFISSQKDEYNNVDILFLLENGFINQQQYEDLMTVISVPMYDYNNFYNKDMGYYRQQGPLNNIQTINDITAEVKNMKRLMKKAVFQRKAESMKDKVDALYDELKRNSSKYQELFKEFAKDFDKELDDMAQDPDNYRIDYDEDYGGDNTFADFDAEDVEDKVFANYDLTEMWTLIDNVYPDMSDDDASMLIDLALDNKGIREIIVDEAQDYIDNNVDDAVSENISEINEQFEDPNAGYQKSHPMDRF